MNTFQLNCFLAVCDSLNFARAAEKLGITQPAVTHQIHTLEDELDVKLFNRSTRSVQLTPAGILFLNDAREILEISMRAKRRFHNPDIQHIEKFVLGAQNSFYLTPFCQVFRSMHEKYPFLHPRFDLGLISYLYRMLDEESLDGIIGFQEPFSQKVAFSFREFGKVPMFCVCPSSHPFALRKSIRIQDTAGEKLILTEMPRLPSSITEFHRVLLEGRDVSDICLSASHETSLFLTESGFGISFLPAISIPSHPGLAFVPIEDWKKLSFGIYYKNAPRSSPLSHFIQLARKELNLPHTAHS